VIRVVVIAAVLLDQLNARLAERSLLAKTGRIKKEVLESSEAPASATQETK